MTKQLPRILAVDDDVATAELIVRVAERCGYEGFATSDSRGVVNLSNALQPDIVSVDICMPNIDANELFRLLSSAGYAGDIMILSGQDMSILRETQKAAEALGLRVTSVTQKPLDLKELRSQLQQRSAA